MNFKKEALDFSKKGLTEFPSEIFSCGRLYKLDLSGNSIKSLPKEIDQLKFLETLNLSGNRIRHLQAKLFNLVNLKFLILNNNEVITLPKQVKNLKKLKVLNLANNNISNLPFELTDMESLVELNLTGNKIDYLPSYDGAYNKLKSLWIANNPLKDLNADEILKNIPKLKALYCFSAKIYNPMSKHDPALHEVSAYRGNVLPILKEKVRVSATNIAQPQVAEPPPDPIVRTGPLKIFISYAHAPDGDMYLKRTQEHLKTLGFEMKIDVWADNKLRGSDIWDDDIKNAINEADAAILLISNAFLASDYIRKNELPPLLKAAEDKGTRIYPILVHPSIFTKIPSLKRFQAINSPAETLSELDYPKQERVFIKLLDDIEYHFGIKMKTL